MPHSCTTCPPNRGKASFKDALILALFTTALLGAVLRLNAAKLEPGHKPDAGDISKLVTWPGVNDLPVQAAMPDPLIMADGQKVINGAHSVKTEGHKIAAYLKKVQSAPGGRHLFGHESTINMGVAGDHDWIELNPAAFTGVDVHSLRSDVKEMTGELPAILGYDAFKLILDITDGPPRRGEVNASIAALKLYRDSGGIIALNWHMQPIGLPGYRERAYRMDETANNPYIALMKEKQPAYRIANGFEARDWWWTEFENKRLAPMAERLAMISKDGSGIILRPFHESDGDWFWWGLKWLEGDRKLNGKDALRTLFVETARYMKQRLPGLMIAFSSDKLGYLDDKQPDAVQKFADEFATFLPSKPEDLELIDIYGIDLYSEKDYPAPSLERFRNKLKGLSRLAKQHGKIAAITEAGNRGLPAEDDSRKPCIDWFNDYLFSWIADPDIDVAFALIWQNWSNNRNREQEDPADGYFIPVHPKSPAGMDFKAYIKRPETIMLDDLKNSWQRATDP